MGSTARRARPAVRGSGAGRGYVILPEGGLCKPAGVSRLAQRAISGALPISENVITVAVVTGDDSPAVGRDDELQERWARRNPGPSLAVLHTEYASAAGPVLAFTGRLRDQRAGQIVVLIPVATPDRPRYRFPHDHLDLMLANPASPVAASALPSAISLRTSSSRGASRPSGDSA